MPDILHLISTWKKEILFLVLLSTITAAAIVFILPGKYLAISTALPANAAAADKSVVFNNTIQELYSTLGTPDDVDKIVGTAQLDTVYLATAMQFDLPSHYNVREKGNAAYLKAATLLKNNSKVTKSEYGELQVRVWDKRKDLAPQLANSIMQRLADMHRNLQNETNRNTIQSLQKTTHSVELSIDTLNMLLNHGEIPAGRHSDVVARKAVLFEKMQQYEKLQSEYQLMLDANPAAVIIVEKAREANHPDKPNKVVVIVASALLSFIFAMLVALLLERRKRKP